MTSKNIVKKLSLLVSSCCLILNMSNALAGGSIPPTKINKVAFQTGGFFMYADTLPNPNGCTRNNAIVLSKTDPNYDKAYALLLAAYTAGKKISGYSDGCINFDGQTYNAIRGFKYLVVQ